MVVTQEVGQSPQARKTKLKASIRICWETGHLYPERTPQKEQGYYSPAVCVRNMYQPMQWN
jgi:hypothetical protein